MRYLFVPFITLITALVSLPTQARNISIRTMATSSAKMPDFFIKASAEKPHEMLRWPTRQPSERVMAKCESFLPLFQRLPDGSGKQHLAIARRVQIPAGAREIILLAWTDGKEVRLRAIEDKFVGAKSNEWLFINASSKLIAFTIGDDAQPITLASGVSRLCQVSSPQNKGAAAVGRAQIRGKLRVFYSTYLPIKEGQRTLMMFTDDGDKIRAKCIVDELTLPESDP